MLKHKVIVYWSEIDNAYLAEATRLEQSIPAETE